jgi:predicted MFS family arabinose efflux permease
MAIPGLGPIPDDSRTGTERPRERGKAGSVLHALLWVGVLAGAALGACVLVLGLVSSAGAPQQAAAGAVAAALAVIPYVAARAFDEIVRG